MCCLTTMLLKLLNYVFYLSATSSCRNGIETVNHYLLQCPQLTLKMFVCCQPLLAEKGYSVGQVKNFTFSKLVSHDKKNICQALIFTLSYVFPYNKSKNLTGGKTFTLSFILPELLLAPRCELEIQNVHRSH